MRASIAVAIVVVAFAAIACSDPERALVAPSNSPAALAAGARWPHAAASGALRAVRAANEQSVAAAPALLPPGAPLPPFVEARLYAITAIAVHDALNAIVPRYERYADDGPIDAGASAEAAALTAARDAIVGAAPASTAATDAWYARAMASVPDAGIPDGIAIGRRAAAAILARRATDGVATGGVAPYTQLTGPGDYRFTAPFDAPPFTFIFPGTGGFADAAVWGTTVTPFVVASASQFRAPRPYGAPSGAAAVLTPAYAADFAEISTLGCAACAARTADQTEAALFWMENSPTGWNRIARTLADRRNLDAIETARLFAQLQMAEFDAYTTSLESKYHYGFWRPVSAVALADTDGNPATSTIAGWQVLAFPTPPVPDYPSAHATAGGAAAVIMETMMPGRVPFSTTSGSLAGVTRAFASVADAARENADSRVFIGYHFRHATDIGLAQGRAVGEYVATNTLRPLRGPR